MECNFYFQEANYENHNKLKILGSFLSVSYNKFWLFGAHFNFFYRYKFYNSMLEIALMLFFFL